jgi:hypothetical protein
MVTTMVAIAWPPSADAAMRAGSVPKDRGSDLATATCAPRDSVTFDYLDRATSPQAYLVQPRTRYPLIGSRLRQRVSVNGRPADSAGCLT